MRTVYSIGLNVGASEPADQLERTLRAVARRCGIVDVAFGAAEWRGAAERFVHIAVQRDGDAFENARRFAADLRQDAVAVAFGRNRTWLLVNAAGDVSHGAPFAQYPILTER